MTFIHDGKQYTVDVDNVVKSENDFEDCGDSFGIEITINGLEKYNAYLWLGDDIEIILYTDEENYVIGMDDMDISVEEISKLEHFFYPDE